MAAKITAGVEPREHVLDALQDGPVIGVRSQETEHLVQRDDILGAGEIAPLESAKQLDLSSSDVVSVATLQVLETLQ